MLHVRQRVTRHVTMCGLLCRRLSPESKSPLPVSPSFRRERQRDRQKETAYANTTDKQKVHMAHCTSRQERTRGLPVLTRRRFSPEVHLRFPATYAAPAAASLSRPSRLADGSAGARASLTEQTKDGEI